MRHGDPGTAHHAVGRGPAAWLVHGADGTAWPVPEDLDEVGVGRLATSDLWVDDPNVSRRHARLVRQDDRYVLVDDGSSNGTFVNGRRIQAAVSLRDGDLVRVGETTLVFRQRTGVPSPGLSSPGHPSPGLPSPGASAPGHPSPGPPRSPASRSRRRLWKVLAISAVVSLLGLVANSLTTYFSHSGNQWSRWLLAPGATVVLGLAGTVLGEWGNADDAETVEGATAAGRRPAPVPRRGAGGALAGVLTVLLVLGVGGVAVTAGVRAVVGHFSSVNRLSGGPVEGGTSEVRLTVSAVLQDSRSTSVELTGVNSSAGVVFLPAGSARLTGSDSTTLDVDALGSHWSTDLVSGLPQRGTLRFRGHFADSVRSATLTFTFGGVVSVQKIPLVPPPS